MQLQSIVDKNYHGANMSAAAMWINLQSAEKLAAMIEHARVTQQWGLRDEVLRMSPTLRLPSAILNRLPPFRPSRPSASRPTVTSHASPQLRKLLKLHPDKLPHAVLSIKGMNVKFNALCEQKEFRNLVERVRQSQPHVQTVGGKLSEAIMLGLNDKLREELAGSEPGREALALGDAHPVAPRPDRGVPVGAPRSGHGGTMILNRAMRDLVSPGSQIAHAHPPFVPIALSRRACPLPDAHHPAASLPTASSWYLRPARRHR